jgi:hypothetical protein
MICYKRAGRSEAGAHKPHNAHNCASPPNPKTEKLKKILLVLLKQLTKNQPSTISQIFDTNAQVRAIKQCEITNPAVQALEYPANQEYVRSSQSSGNSVLPVTLESRSRCG